MRSLFNFHNTRAMTLCSKEQLYSLGSCIIVWFAPEKRAERYGEISHVTRNMIIVKLFHRIATVLPMSEVGASEWAITPSNSNRQGVTDTREHRHTGAQTQKRRQTGADLSNLQ